MSLYSSLTQVLAPFAAKINGLLTGWDGTKYTTPGEAVRQQIADLHVLIGDEPGTAISASAISYGESDVETALDGVNTSIGDMSKLETETKTDLVAAINEAAQTGGSGSGLTAEIKNALLQIASKVAYIDAHGQDYYDDLYAALYAITDIRIKPHSIMLNAIGATSQITATTIPEGGSISWASSDTSVATVDSTGLVTSVGFGTAVITATSGSLSVNCNVTIAQATVTNISAEYTPTGKVFDTETLDSLKDDLVVTATWSNGTTSVVSDDNYTLNGTLVKGTNTITASYAGKSTTFSVTVVGVDSITATYAQTRSIYDSDSLNKLKDDLIVSARYSDGSSNTVTDYTLEGTLTAGTSTITARYGGCTASFSVTVTEGEHIIYSLPRATTFDGSEHIDTGVKLLDEDRDFTILGCINTNFSDLPSGGNATVFHCMHEVSPWPGIVFDIKNGGTRLCWYTGQQSMSPASLKNFRFAIKHEKTTNIISIKYGLMGSIIYSISLTSAFTAIEETLVLGAFRDVSGTFGRFFKGTINEFEIKDIALSDSAMDDYVQTRELPQPVYSVTDLNFDGATLINTGVKPWTAENINKYLLIELRLDEWVKQATGTTLLDASSVYTSSDNYKGFMYMVDIPNDAGILRLLEAYKRTIGAGTVHILRLENTLKVAYTSNGTVPTQYQRVSTLPADALSTVSDSAIMLGGRRDNTWFYTGKIKSIDIYFLD